MVREELGPEAAVLHTRELRPTLWGLWGGTRQVEVSASLDVRVPSRFVDHARAEPVPGKPGPLAGASLADEGRAAEGRPAVPPADAHDYRGQFRDDLKDQLAGLQSLVEQLCRQSTEARHRELPEVLFRLLTDLIDGEVSEEVARELVERLRVGYGPEDWDDELLAKARLARLIEEEIDCCGPLTVTPGRRRLVALVGPTGVGKTTTVAKLAAEFHLRQRCRVGLITVDTYRIAAVDQLRTYADIIDLPMEVVATPREMRAALARLADMDLVLMDTAGRSPRDEVRIQELKSMLEEAQADEVLLVLSGVTSLRALTKAAEKFAPVGVTSLILTKLDEAAGLGSLLSLLRASRLPVSYVTNGQNVPDDIAAADRRALARAMLSGGTGR